MAFDDGLSACLACIEEVSGNVTTFAGQLLGELRAIVPEHERVELNDWLEASTELTSDTEARCFSRMIAGKALRLGLTVEVLAERLRLERSIDIVL